MGTNSKFEALIARNQLPGTSVEIAQEPLLELVPNPYDASGNHGALIQIRQRGGMVVSAALVPPDGMVATPVLSSNATDTAGLLVPRLGASFAMMPVGPNDGPGGQHGPLRYVDFVPTAKVYHKPQRGRGLFHVVELEAELPPDSPFSATRHIGFIALNRLVIATTIRNLSGKGMTTSLGEHMYFGMPDDATVDDITLNKLAIDERLGSGATADIAAGKPRLWKGFNGMAVVQLSGQLTVEITSSTTPNTRSRGTPVPDMLLWRRVVNGMPSPTVCLEPVAGFSPDPSEAVSPIVIPADESITHRTIVRLLQPAA